MSGQAGKCLNCQLKRRDKSKTNEKWAKSEKISMELKRRVEREEMGTRTIQHPVERKELESGATVTCLFIYMYQLKAMNISHQWKHEY